MKKNNKICLAILLCVLLIAVVVMAACSKPYTLTFDTNGGTEIAPIPFGKGQKITVPTTTKEYFTFDGWYADAQFTTQFDQFNKMPDNDVTVYAKWISGESGKIIFNTNGGSAVEDLTGAVGQTVSRPADPTKEGYVFGGWYMDAECTSLYVFGTMQRGTLTLYAKWSKDGNYNYVTYILNGVSTVIPVLRNSNAVIPAQNDDVECSWYTDDEYTTEYNFNLSVNTDLKLYGIKYSKGLAFSGDTVTSYSGNSSEIFVPEKYNGQWISTIGASAFSANNSINYVNLPQTVVTIEDAAFYKCEYLVKINVFGRPDDATDDAQLISSVGKYAFADCVRMVSAIDLSGVTVLSESAFANCGFLDEVELGNSMEEIGANAFINCTSLTSIKLPDSVQSIGDYAFANSAIATLTVPASLAHFGKGVVKGCDNLASVVGGNTVYVVDSNKGTLSTSDTLHLYFTCEANQHVETYELPANYEHIAPYAFYGNVTIKQLDVSNSVSPLDKGSLEGMKSLETLKVRDLDSNNGYLAYWFGASTAQSNGSSGLYVPNSLREVTFTNYSATEVGDYAFYGCTGLSSINGINNITSVGEYAYGYTAITSYNVASGVTNIDKTAFRGVRTLQEITVDSGNANYSAYDGALYDLSGDKLIYVPENKTNIAFAETASEICEGAMYRSCITNLTVPQSIVKIGFGAFENMTSLRSLSVPYIGDGGNNTYMLYVFGALIEESENGNKIITAQKCPASLTSITITGNVSEIPEDAFIYCSTVSHIDCGNEYTSIGAAAFYGTALTSIIIPDSVQTIGNSAFYNCADATSIVIGKGVEKIEAWAFAMLSSLKSVVFEEGQQDLVIGDYAFFAPISTRTSNGATYVSASYSRLEEIKFSNNVVSIGKEAFRFVGYYGSLGNNPSYTYFNVSFDVENSRLETIGEYAFQYSGISSVVLPNSIKNIGDLAFAYCSVLGSITIYKQPTDRKDIPALGNNVIYNSFNVRIYVPKNSLALYKGEWMSLGLADCIEAIKEA